MLDPRIARIAGLLGQLPGVQQTQMGGLFGGGPVAPARMPQLPMPTGDQPSPGRQGEGLLDRAGNALMPTPAGLDGLLSPEDISRSRRAGLLNIGLSLLGNTQGAPGQNAPGTLQAIGQGLQAGAAGYRGANQETLTGKLTGMQLQQQVAQMKAKQAIAAKMQQAYPNFATMTPQQQHQAVTAMFGEAIANNLWDEAGKIASVLPSMQPGKDAEYKLPFKDVDRGGKIERHYPDGRVEMVDKFPSARDPNSADHAKELSDQRTFQREQAMVSRADRLGDTFYQQTKMHQTVADNLGVLEQTAPGALKGDPQAQQALIFSFMKILDPGSIVMPGEYASAANAGSVPEKLRAQYNKVLQGGFLDTAQVERMLAQARAQRVGWQMRFKPILDRHTDIAKRANLDPRNVVYDYYGALPPVPTAQQNTPGSNPLLNP